MWNETWKENKGERIMGKLKEHMIGWLDEYGNELGYDMSNCPSLEDFWWVAEHHVEAEDYWKGKWEPDKK